jgi:pilus assembly protein Flp/PilA
MKSLLHRFATDDSGATAMEYGLIAALLAVAIIASLTGLGSALSTKFNSISASLTNATH